MSALDDMSILDDVVNEHAGKTARAELAALRQRVAELESAQAVVTPNNCRHCHKAAEKMREAAAKLIEGKRLTQNEIDEGIIWSYNCTDKFAEYIRALPLPTCGDCNPLAPVVCNNVLHKCAVCGQDADGPFYCAEHK